MNRVKYSQDTLTHVLCTFVFALFSFFYLYYYQADLMTICSTCCLKDKPITITL